MRFVNRICLVGLVVLLASSGQARAQFYFGKNKVQYTEFHWQVMKTEHFELYFYPEERELAEAAAAMAERSYLKLSAQFQQSLSRPIPLILYSAHNYFQQTNTIPYLLPEGVGGFMEFMKGRVVVPFDGSYARLDRTIRHELVHVFTLAKVRTVLHDHKKYQYHLPPLWMIEGLAEHWSGPWDAEAEMVLRDAVISGNLVSLEQMYRINGTFQMYKEGQSAAAFIAERYGSDKILRLLENWWKGKKFAHALEATLGCSLEEVDRLWQYSLKKRYFPLLKDHDMPRQVAEQLTFQGSNVKPALYRSPSGEQEGIVFMSNRMGYEAVYLLTFDEQGVVERRLIRGERSPELESLHLLRSRLDISAAGVLAFISKSQETDVLNLWDVPSGRLVQKFQFPRLVSLSSPSWSPEGDRIAFSGADRNGHVDLYLVEVDGGQLRQLTDDLYDDREPSWSPDGRLLAFSSDRSPAGRQGFRNLFIYHIDQGTLEPLTEGAQDDTAPCWAPDGRHIAFSSDREGVFNIYLLEVGHPQRCVHRVTNILTGAFDPVWTDDGKELIFCAYAEGKFQLFRLAAPPALPEGAPISGPISDEPWAPEKLIGEQAPVLGKYRQKMSLDIAQSAVSYDPVFGVGGGFQMAFTDMLGDRQYYLLINNTASDRRDFLSSFNFAGSYFDLSQRTNFGGGVFHFVDDYFDDYYGWYYERQYGGFATLSHPFSKFHRAELTALVKSSDRENYDFGRSRSTILSGNYISLIKDTSLWGSVGPVDGSRMKLSLGITWEPRTGRVFNRTLMVDLRQYLRISQRISHAVRLAGRLSQGVEPQIFYMGGSWDMRGYPRRHFMGRKLVLLNNELRLPVIDNLLVGFPFGDLELEAIGGALFFDVGNAWNEDLSLKKELFQVDGSFGLGLRARVGYFTVLRLDVAKTTDFDVIFPQTKVQFFFGWNY